MVRRPSSLVIDQSGRLFTAADLAALPTHLPSGDVDFELENGRIVVLVPSGHLHGAVHARLCGLLSEHGEGPGHGEVLSRAGLILSRNPDTVLGPDLAFITNAKLPARESSEGYLETIPDLVVEVRDRSDTTAELDSKVAAYLAAGVQIVWVVDPVARTIVAHRSGGRPRIFGESENLTLDEVIPSFCLNLAELFRS